MGRHFLFKKEDETWSDYYTRTCRIGREHGVTFVSEVIAESMWRAMGWVCDDRPNAAVDNLKHVFQMETYEMVAVHASIRDGKEPAQPHEVETEVVWPNRGYFWDKLATEWAGKEDWMSKRKYYAFEDKTKFVIV